ncbi:fumarylacetoacetate hydrolase family protein [Saccharopolyspora shandongensis]|uniref:2-keto-4-pentenoate hydratase n=1 Tax=Saccharopolyspora shandongensis TaxID=418495 RepID=UPI0033FE9C05
MTASEHEKIQQAGRLLWEASVTRQAIPPVRNLVGADDISIGYAIQELLTLRKLRDGGRVVGRKIGLTSPAVQQQLGVGQPDFGILFHDMARTELEAIDLRSLIAPKVEAEVAFVLAADLDDRELSREAVRDKVDYVAPALEIVDSRIKNWDISIVDTVADNASSALFVLGQQKTPIDDLDLAGVQMELINAGDVVSTGDGAACLGSPLNALLWLARTYRKLGRNLRAGEVILSGALGPMAPVEPGAEYRATISGIGTVSARFDEGEPA